MRRMMWTFTVLLLVVALAGVLTPVWSQEVTAAIVGTVTDPS